MEARTELRPSALAGMWYPEEPDVLGSLVDRLLAEAPEPNVNGELIALVAPHAGIKYSGGVAAAAFRQVGEFEPQFVVIVSPLHLPYPGQVFTSGHSAYTTPLGHVTVARDMLDRLEELLPQGLRMLMLREDREHSVEIELPFLQRALRRPFRLLPLMLGDQTWAVVHPLAQSLAQLLANERSLLIASSDLSHFYPAQRATQFDAELLRRIVDLDPEGVLEAEEHGVGFACGRGAVATVLSAALRLGANHARLLRYAHSGEITLDDEAVVGYGAVGIYRRSKELA
ncbi:MAG TPA: AmmeMemoRadiSam system protein B [Anaerolineales bacterium]|nr:AmmeMemoRadiSam system protein B [Anaerolineales bacterium]